MEQQQHGETAEHDLHEQHDAAGDQQTAQRAVRFGRSPRERGQGRVAERDAARVVAVADLPGDLEVELGDPDAEAAGPVRARESGIVHTDEGADHELRERERQ